jgi:hypothetical protein
MAPGPPADGSDTPWGAVVGIQMGFSGDEPGIGHGIFVMDLDAVP